MSTIGYREFVPRLYNWCKKLGMTKGLMLPSIGFCSDENQGYPTMLILKHFGTYPFNHGYIGGILALDRHGPHASHGEDMVIFCAPHVGFDPDTKHFGNYRRIQVANKEAQSSTCCGKVAGVLAPYRDQYKKILGRIKVRLEGEKVLVSLADSIERDSCDGRGIVLKYDQLLAPGAYDAPLYQESLAKVYEGSDRFAAAVREAFAGEPRASAPAPKASPEAEKRAGLLSLLLPGQSPAKEEVTEAPALAPTRADSWRSLSEPFLSKVFTKNMFYFLSTPLEGEANRLERLLLPHMPYVLNGPWDPELMAAMICCQAEFGRTVHSVEYEKSYKGKNLVVVSGVNIDICPELGSEGTFPSTMFLPWAAYVQLKNGKRQVYEQAEFVKLLREQSNENADAINIEKGVLDLFTNTPAKVDFYRNP